MDLDYETKFCLVGVTTCVATAGILVVRKLVKKRTTKRKLRRSATSDIELWENLKQMDTADFLTNLDEMLGAFQMSTLALSREKLRVIMLTRQRQLADELEVSKGEVDLKLEEMGSLMNEVRCFIMSNLIKAEHKSLKKLTPYFNEIAMQLKRVSAEPEVLLTESTDGSILSFEEVRDLFTILIESTGTPRTLRAQARSLKDELEDSWHKLRKSKSHYKHTLTDVNEWKEFFEENSNVITEILDKREWWPES